MKDPLDIRSDIDRMRNAATSISQMIAELDALRSHLDRLAEAIAAGKLNGIQVKLTRWGDASWDAGIVHHVPGVFNGGVNVEAKKKFMAAYREFLLTQVEAVYKKIQDEREKL